MAGQQIYVETEDIASLAKEILVLMRDSANSNKRMKTELSTLSESFRDAGYDWLCEMVNNCETYLMKAIPDLMDITDKLRDYNRKISWAQEVL